MISYSPTGAADWMLLCKVEAVLFLEAKVAQALEPLLTGLASADPVGAVLGKLTAGGISATPSFVLATWLPGGVLHVIVRGSAIVEVATDAGPETVDGSTVSTWRETTIAGVQTVDIRAAQPAAAQPAAVQPAAAGPVAPLLPLRDGVAWAAGVRLDLTLEVPRVVRVTAPAMIVPPVAVSAVVMPPVEENTSLPVEEHTMAEPAEIGIPAVVTEDAGYAHLFESTVIHSVEDAAVRPAGVDEPGEPAGEPSSEESESGDHDGETVMSGDIASLRAGAREAAAAAAAAAAAPGSVVSGRFTIARPLFLELSTGGREPLTQPILVGRAPTVSKVSGGSIPRLVSIPGDQDISRNHAQFALEGDTVVVTDLHSRNGTSIMLPGKSPRLLRQGEPTAVIVGTVVDLGGGVTITVREER